MLSVFCIHSLLGESRRRESIESISPATINTEARELFSFLSLLFSVQAPCPKHGPLSHHCHHEDDHHDNFPASSESDNQQTEDDDATGGDDFNWNDADSNEYDFGQYSEEVSTGSSIGPTDSADNFSLWMLLAAGAAAVVAFATVMLGLRTPPTKAHPLSGSVARRMELFGNFADAALCSTDRPDRVVEMTASTDDYRVV
ncbi:hypothetical protein FisN_15Hu359 [Fistulifera solaris]|uniref:Uncharacterized protein n=1 Tax=Fistulifera solaris TaxID=1519565 RepID=A0A1Z5JGI7_FISSO|nr:hypothetical protein FisN_15Hu359 [Fistulifera solaris]|eukprot:GAX12871.1 hypothetical protein FisN_15Hu359 [Fistulifera solaris]